MNGHREIALWAGLSSFFSSMLAITVFNVFKPDSWINLVGALIVAFFTAGSVYARRRYDDAREKRVRSEL